MLNMQIVTSKIEIFLQFRAQRDFVFFFISDYLYFIANSLKILKEITVLLVINMPPTLPTFCRGKKIT